MLKVSEVYFHHIFLIHSFNVKERIIPYIHCRKVSEDNYHLLDTSRLTLRKMRDKKSPALSAFFL